MSDGTIKRKTAIEGALEGNMLSARLLSRNIDYLRFKKGFRHDDVFQYFKDKVPSLTLTQWEQLMQRLDSEEMNIQGGAR